MSDIVRNRSFYDGLKALVESAFPKKCANCGKTFSTASQFIEETKTIRQEATGLKQSVDDDNMTIVEMYRNCSCGSTLMDFFTDRRDVSDAGKKRRDLFNDMLPSLEKTGLNRAGARDCLLRLLRNQPTEDDRKIITMLNSSA